MLTTELTVLWEKKCSHLELIIIIILKSNLIICSQIFQVVDYEIVSCPVFHL